MFGKSSRPEYPYPPKDAWFRSPEWDEAAQIEFAKRLARARPRGRPQYRWIKALGLLSNNDPDIQNAGCRLLEEVIADPLAYEYERVDARSRLAAHAHAVGALRDAERLLRLTLETRSVSHGSGGTEIEEIRLAEVLLAQGGQRQLEEARELLERSAVEDFAFLDSRFRMCVAGVRVSLALNDAPRAAAWAADALKLAGATYSGLQNHPRLGLVEADAETLGWLATTAAGTTPSE